MRTVISIIPSITIWKRTRLPVSFLSRSPSKRGTGPHIESITVKGNDRTKDYVILREIPLEVGDVFNRTKLIEGWQSLMSTQYFSSVEPQTYQGSTDLLMDLVIDVEEGQTANIMFGMTFSGGPDFPISAPAAVEAIQISWVRGKPWAFRVNSLLPPSQFL